MHIDWSSLFGRLHPLVVHFPIGLVLGAAAIEIIGWARKRPFPGPVFDAFLGVATVGATVSVFTGWWFARQQENADGSMLQWHRWLGIGVAVLCAGTWLAGRQSAETTRRWLLLFTALLVAICGHLGGLLVWHDDFFN